MNDSFMLSVVYTECRKQAHYVVGRYSECRYVEYCDARVP